MPTAAFDPATDLEPVEEFDPKKDLEPVGAAFNPATDLEPVDEPAHPGFLSTIMGKLQSPQSADYAADQNITARGIGQALDYGKQGLEAVLPPGFIEHVTTPVFEPTNYPIGPEIPTADRYANVILNKGTGLVSGLSSPAMVATGATGGVSPVLAKAVEAYFLQDVARHTPEVFQQFKDAKTGPEYFGAGLDAATTAAIGALLGKGLAKPLPAKAAQIEAELRKGAPVTSEARTSQGQQIPTVEAPVQAEPQSASTQGQVPSAYDAEYEAMKAHLEELNRHQFLPERPSPESAPSAEIGKPDKAPEYDPDAVGARELIRRRVAQGATREQALAENTAALNAVDAWADALPTGTVIRRSERNGGGEFTRDSDGNWYDNSGHRASGTLVGAEVISRPETTPASSSEGPVLPLGRLAIRSHAERASEVYTTLEVGKRLSQTTQEGVRKGYSQPETTPEQPSVTSTKNAQTAAERTQRGIAPAEEVAAREFGTVWDEAKAKVAEDASAPRRLVESLADNPRALSDTENALLLHRQIEVQNEHDAAVKAVNAAPGDAEAQTRLDRVRDDLQATYEAAKSSGTETGRGLNARKMLANADYSLAKMEAETRAVVNNGRPLSPEQIQAVHAEHARLVDKEKQHDALLEIIKRDDYALPSMQAIWQDMVNAGNELTLDQKKQIYGIHSRIIKEQKRQGTYGRIDPFGAAQRRAIREGRTKAEFFEEQLSKIRERRKGTVSPLQERNISSLPETLSRSTEGRTSNANPASQQSPESISIQTQQGSQPQPNEPKFARQVRSIDKNTGSEYSLHDETRRAFEPSQDKSADLALAAIAKKLGTEADSRGQPAGGGDSHPRLTKVEIARGNAHPSDRASLRAAELLARRAGVSLDFFRGDSPTGIDGVYTDKRILINVDSLKDPVHTIAGHEVWHSIEESDPILAGALRRAVEINRRGYERYRSTATRKGYEDHPGVIASELMGDLFGEAMRDPKKLHDAIGSSLAKRVLVRLQQWAQQAIRYLRGKQPEGPPLESASAAVRNLEEVQARIVAALRGDTSKSQIASKAKGVSERASYADLQQNRGSSSAIGNNSQFDSASFKRSDKPKAIDRAAIKMLDGSVFYGRTHAEAAEGARFAKYGPDDIRNSESGFVSNEGEYLNRTDAETRAAEMGQLQHDSQEGLEAQDFARTRRDEPSFARQQPKPAESDDVIIGASHIAKGAADYPAWADAVRQDQVTPTPELYRQAKAFHDETAAVFRSPEQKRLDRLKTGTIKRAEEYRSRLEAGDFEPRQRNVTVPDAELLHLRADAERAKDDFRLGLEKARRSQRPLNRKIIDTFVEAMRSFKLTGITTLGKLGSAGVTRLATTPLEEAVGTILSKSPILSKVAAAAPREGGFSFRAEGRALTSGIAQGVRDAPRILKGQRTDAEVLAGEKARIGSVLDYPGRVHGVIKAPFKEAERARAMAKRTAFAERHLDPNDPKVQESIRKAANQDAKRAIFMQDNILSEFWNQGIRSLEHSKRFPTAGYALAKVAKFLLPIVKVPTNVAFETMTHLGGTLTASGKLIQVMHRGIKTIRPEEADMIMRHYKKGAIGIGLFLTGYFNADKLGGYYIKGEKPDEKDLKHGTAKLMGVNIPAWMLHSPAALVMQAGATAAHVLHGKKPKSEWQAGIAVARGVVEQIPFMAELGTIDNSLADDYKGTSVRGRMLQGAIIPQASKDIAAFTDRQNGAAVQRKPQNELDYVKAAIPGLRQQVPTVEDAMRQQKWERKRAEMHRHLTRH